MITDSTTGIILFLMGLCAGVMLAALLLDSDTLRQAKAREEQVVVTTRGGTQ